MSTPSVFYVATLFTGNHLALGCVGTALRKRGVPRGGLPTEGDPPSAPLSPHSGLDSPLCLELPRFGRDDGRTRDRSVDHSTINRWVLKYASELDLRIRPHRRFTNDSWQVMKRISRRSVGGGIFLTSRSSLSKGNGSISIRQWTRRGIL